MPVPVETDSSRPDEMFKMPERHNQVVPAVSVNDYCQMEVSGVEDCEFKGRFNEARGP